ncbi:MAG: leucine-rich repeat protein [Muribaculaceae bacterium]|nr:leucine-rich repeat protein [Muribaculaceae bacterium]
MTVSPAVETIGASAFAGNSKLSNITMGYQVKTIGEKAFDGAPAQTVSITAQVPPTAPNNTFSSYTGKLWLQDPGDESVMLAYLDAYTCWDRFESYALIAPEKVVCDVASFNGKPGDTFTLSPKFTPENTTLKKVFWRSTNPDIATVDADGVVTLRGGKEVASRAAESCQIIGETLYADVPAIEVAVSNAGGSGATGPGDEPGTGDDDDPNTSGINEIDYQADYEVYNLGGVKVGNSVEGLEHGFYIVRQGATAKKIAIK